jgi:hypothetical protein
MAKTEQEKLASKATRDAAKLAKAATMAEMTMPTYPDEDANAKNVLGNTSELRPGGPAKRNRARVPDAAFFADLPKGFIPPRRADYLADIVARLQDFNTDAEKVIWLRHNTSPVLTYLLRLAFCKDVEWLIPAGAPEFKQWKGRRYSSPSELKRECRRLYLFIKGGNDLVADVKRQKLFAQMLEGLEKTEIGVLLAIKDRTLDKDYGLTAELVNLSFPGILDAPFAPKFCR